MHKAVREGNEESVRYLLQELKLDPNAAGSGRWNVRPGAGAARRKAALSRG